MAKTKKRGGEKAPRSNKPAREGSVLDYKSWCVSHPPNSRTINKSKKAYSDMTPEEKEEFCPSIKGELASAPPSEPPSRSQSPPPRELTALEKLAARKADVPEGVLKAKSSNTERGWIGVHKQVPAAGSRRRKRSRKTKRKTRRHRK